MTGTQPPGEVLDLLGLQVDAELSGESENHHWRVKSLTELAVLRRVAPRSTIGLEYELSVLVELERRGWPVPVPLIDPVEIADATWVVYRLLPGAPPTAEDTHDQRERGRLLARLHNDLIELVPMGQRDGWRMSHELLAAPELPRLLVDFERRHPVEGHLLRWHADRAVQLLAELPVEEATLTVVHGDLAPWNLLFLDGQLTGIVDFDVSHLDVSVADFGCSWRGKYDAVILGYNDIRPLTELDWALITPIFWAWLFIGVADDLASILTGDATCERLEWMMSKLALRSPAMGPTALPYPGPP